MQILCNTYLKVLRKEKVLLLINIISLGFSVGLSSIGAYLLKDINFIIISMVIAIAARNIIAEIYLARNMNLKVCFVNRKCIKMTRKVQHPDNPIMLI
jgi:hypothetical protein